MNFSKTFSKTLGKMYSYMGERTQQGAIQLLDQMTEKADSDAEYANKLKEAFAKGSTVELREAAEEFGQYWKGMSHQKRVDAIDSALNMVHDKSRNKDGNEFTT